MVKSRDLTLGLGPSEEFRDMISYQTGLVKTWSSQVPVHAEIILEGYAFADKGQVFNIGENTGLLKHKLYKNNLHPHIVTPTEIKKCWKTPRGKGNASKTDMYNAFVC